MINLFSEDIRILNEMKKQCTLCLQGEHDNYDDNVVLVYVRDDETNRIIKRSYMCESHRTMYENDGYIVLPCPTK